MHPVNVTVTDKVSEVLLVLVIESSVSSRLGRQTSDYHELSIHDQGELAHSSLCVVTQTESDPHVGI